LILKTETHTNTTQPHGASHTHTHTHIMDQQGQRGRSPSIGHQQPHIKQSHSPSPNPYQQRDASIGLGLGLDQSSSQSFASNSAASTDFSTFSNSGANNYLNPQQSQNFQQNAIADQSNFDPSQNFGQQFKTETTNSNYLDPTFTGSDFSLFPPPSGQGEQFNTPLFEQSLNSNDMNTMATPQTHHSPTPPHMLQPESHQPTSAHQSPAFNQHHFSSPAGRHSRNASLGPEAALMPNQLGGDWAQPQFQGHRRSPSEYSDVSSAAPSPNLVSADSFDPVEQGHSPMQRPSDAGLYQDVLNMGNFSISDPQHSSPNLAARSPSHSPAISPRILPQQMPELNQPPNFLAPQNNGYMNPAAYGVMPAQEAFPALQTPGQDLHQMAPPAINIDFAPTARQNAFDQPKSHMDQDSLTPPDRGM
jgi:transcription factor CRZ1